MASSLWSCILQFQLRQMKTAFRISAEHILRYLTGFVRGLISSAAIVFVFSSNKRVQHLLIFHRQHILSRQISGQTTANLSIPPQKREVNTAAAAVGIWETKCFSLSCYPEPAALLISEGRLQPPRTVWRTIGMDVYSVEGPVNKIFQHSASQARLTVRRYLM